MVSYMDLLLEKVDLETEQSETTENEDISLDQVTEAEEQPKDQVAEDTENNS